jgi:hypothetical protein
MEFRPRPILASLMSDVMVFMVIPVVAILNLGFTHDFLLQWVKAHFISWPIAATTAFFVMPPARRLTDLARARIDGVQ